MKETPLKPEEITAALQELRAQKNDETSPGFFVYQLINSAHPLVKDVIEHQAAVFLASGKKVAAVIGEASKTEAGRRRIQQELGKIMSGVTPKKTGENDHG